MGGYGVVIAETNNFVWTIHVSLMMDCPRHWLQVEDKRDQHREISMREEGYDEGEASKAFDEALDELEKSQGNREYHALTSEQLTLS